VKSFARELAYAAGALLPARCALLGDRACLALAHALRAAALTTDRAWRALELAVQIEVIR
jgi:PIN domain nuclease of toxin-antitoxin system